MRRILQSVLILTGSLALGVWLAQATGLTGLSDVPPPELSYQVRAEPDSAFVVEVRVDGLRSRHPEFRLLEGWGLLQDQGTHVTRFRASDENGEPLPVTVQRVDGEIRWRLPRRPAGAILLSYRILPYDPDLSPESSFAVRDRFVLLGYSLFLVPGGVSAYAPVDIEVQIRAPRHWPVWASWPGESGRYRPPTLHDLWSGAAAGGAFRPSRMQAGPVAVTVLTESPIPDLVGLSVANRLFPAIREMVSLFGAPPRGDSLSVLALYRAASRREAVSALYGCSEESAFLCLATPERFREADELTAVAVHECVHFYLGGAVSADGEPPYRNSPDLVWLMEGVTEYLTYRLLEEAGSLPPGATDRVALRKEREMLAAPGPGITLAEAARRMEDAEAYALVYSRGFLVARLIEQVMEERRPGSFTGALRDLFEAHRFYDAGATVTPADVRAVFEARCPGIGESIDRYAAGAEPLPAVNLAQTTSGAD